MMYRRGIIIVSLSFLLLACASSQQQKTNHKIAESNVRLGVGYFQQGKTEAALEKMKKALKAEPDYPDAHGSIALVYQRLGEDEKAKEHYEIALELQPNKGITHNNYATLLCKMGKPLLAEPHFLEAINDRRYRTPAQALGNLGSCLMLIPDVDKAEKYLRQALQLNPKLPGALLQMVHVALERKRYMSGRAYLQRYQEVAKMDPASLMLGIQVESNLGDKNTVIDYQTQLRRNFPDSNETRNLMKKEFGKKQNR